ncbi:hypothetical protein U3516DRAFT_837395 [Neocallimastix sp. 'constans']
MKGLYFNIILIYAENENYIVAIRRSKNDKKYDYESPEIQKKIDELVNDKMNDIYEIIDDNKETYILENGQMDEKLKELDNSVVVRKRSNKNHKFIFTDGNRKYRNKRSLELNQLSNNSTEEYIPIESVLVNHLCPISNYYTINVYLSEETQKIVCKLDNVIYCEKVLPIKIENVIPSDFDTYNLNSNTESNSSSKSNIYYDIKKIKNETNWSGVSVQSFPYTPNHLALLSQSAYVNMNKPFDNNFYYPSSAGKGIDIFLVDTGLNVNHEDFDTSERTVTCDAIATEYGTYINEGEEKKHCIGAKISVDHGEMVTSVSGGSIYGVAKKANLHMIAIDLKSASTILALDYIMRYAKNPNKSVISMSLGHFEYSQASNDKLDDVISKGFSIFVAAGNNNSNSCESKESGNFTGYSGYRKAIAVGAIENDVYGNGYYRIDYSNYGDCVDIFAPGTVVCADIYKGTISASGTSLATPIVAGIAATIMSENPGIKFNKEKLVKMIIDSSMKNVIHNLGSSDTPNRLVNNGKVSIYRNENKKSCGKGVGSCSEGCCTKNGVCLTYNYYPWEECLVENGCQSEFGSCTSKNQAIKDCEKEYNDNKNCYVEISSDMNDAEFIDHCKILESNQCKVYFRKKINNLSICTIAKKYRSFNFIENFDEKKYHSSLKLCHTTEKKLESECITQMKEYQDCLINGNINLNDPYSFGSNFNRCSKITSSKCSTLYNEKTDELRKKLSYCYLLKDHYGKDIIKDKINVNIFYKNAYQNYNDFVKFCDNTKEKSIDICDDIIDEHSECQINKNENKYDCNTFISGKCQNFYNLLNMGRFVCNIAKKYKSYDIVDNLKSEKFNQYQEKCEMMTLNTNAKRLWIYNESTGKCLFAPDKINQPPVLKDCNDNNLSQWYISSYDKSIIQSASNTNRCLNIVDPINGTIEINKCTDSIQFKYFSDDGVIFSPTFGSRKCLSVGDGKSAKTNNSVYYRVCNQLEDQKWSLWNRNPSGSSNSKTRIVWIYNRKINRCLSVGLNINDRPTAFECRNSNRYQWEIPVSGDGFFKNVREGWCLHVNDINSDKESNIVMGKCDGYAVIKDISSTYNGESIISILGENKCLDSINLADPTTTDLKLSVCNKNNDFQHWEIRTTFPGDVVKCGKGYGNCPSGQCCSKDGICGTMDNQCGTGCQPSYGKCHSNISTTIASNAKPKWIYNASVDKCLYTKGKGIYDYNLLMKDCEDNNKFKWYISPYPKGYFHSASLTDYCLTVNSSNNNMAIRDCDSSTALDYTDDGIIYSVDIGNGECMSASGSSSNINLKTCNKSDEQIWSVWDRNPYEITRLKTRTVWIYNKKLNKCLISGSSFTYRPYIGNCSDEKKAKWEIPVSGDGFFKSLYKGYCLYVTNNNRGTIVMRQCNNNAIIKDIKTSINKESIMSPLNSKKCLGLLESNGVKLNMNTCDNSKNDQHWEIRTKNPASN